jgi:hypothetical protein
MVIAVLSARLVDREDSAAQISRPLGALLSLAAKSFGLRRMADSFGNLHFQLSLSQ